MKTRHILIYIIMMAAVITQARFAAAQIAPPPVPPPDQVEPDVTPDPSGEESNEDVGNNHPPMGWYNPYLIEEMIAFEQAALELRNWAYQKYDNDYNNNREYYEMYYFADWIYGYLNQYRGKTYYTQTGSKWVTERYWDGNEWKTRSYRLNYDDHTPKWFNGHGYYATRGDHNNFHYNYLRPVYHWVMQFSATVRNKYGYGSNSNYYALVDKVVKSYKRYTKCNWGQSPFDPDAPIDTEEYILEAERDALGYYGNTSLATGRSSTIALTSDNQKLLVVNRQSNSLTVIQVRDKYGKDTYNTIAEISVGRDPRFVTITSDGSQAFVGNGQDGTISIINLTATPPQVIGSPIKVGNEPRGLVVTPNGKYLFVANHTDGSVSIVDAKSYAVLNTIFLGGNPQAIAISNDGDGEDQDEKVYVTRFFSELIESRLVPDGFNDAKQGVVDQFTVREAIASSHPTISKIYLAPIDDTGFTADRRQFCQKTRNILQNNGEVVFFNSGVDGKGNGAGDLVNESFCPDIYSKDANANSPIANDPQGAYPNQLFAILLRDNHLFIPNIGASPEPPVKFNTNVQALVSHIDLSKKQEVVTNLNDQIKLESQPAYPNQSLDRLFANDVVAIDADVSGKKFLIVSRGGNYVIRATLQDNGTLSINAPDRVIRFLTGNIPSGIVMSGDGKRAYTNNEVSTSVTAIDLEKNLVLARDIDSSTPPKAGTRAHRNIVGKLAFFTALGIQDTLDLDHDGKFDIEIRDIVPLEFRGKASDNAWSDCASCHEDGHSDNVTWIFPTGPRQSIPLEGTFARGNNEDQRILNWNAVRGSITDFNNNSRGVQGGIGHATNVKGIDRTGEIFNHGPTIGISDALDAMTEWVANAVRTLNQPQAADENLDNGETVFAYYCSQCHGGAKFSKSSVAEYINNPSFANNPLGPNFFAAGREPPLDPKLEVAGPQIVAVNQGWDRLQFLDDVGTFDPTKVTEIRGAGALGGGVINIAGDPNEGVDVAAQSTQGFPSLGGIGFNAPSLLGVGYHAPFFHDGSAISLEEVFKVHRLPDAANRTIEDVIYYADDLNDLKLFLLSIDDRTAPIH